MRYKITGRNINVTPGLKAAVEEKIGKLERYFNQDTEVNITLTVEKDRQKIEVTIPVKGTIIRAEQESNDMYVSPAFPESQRALQGFPDLSSPCPFQIPCCLLFPWPTAGCPRYRLSAVK